MNARYYKLERLILVQQTALREVARERDDWKAAADVRQRERDEAREYARGLFFALSEILQELWFHIRTQDVGPVHTYQCVLGIRAINKAVDALPPAAQRHFATYRNLGPAG